MTARRTTVPDPVRNRRVAATAVAISVAMLGLAYASVPLYRMFCQATGFGGTTQRAAEAPATTGRLVTVRFDANASPVLGWQFHPARPQVSLKLGEEVMAHYVARNMTSKPVTGSAVFNVTPASAGAYFNKIQCFCFTEQTLQPGESIDMPVVFFVDPALADDPDTAAVSEITLSYTFYPVTKSNTAAAATPATATKTN
jgi:cytochrome c oxidase assembly protein subunit 11